MALSIAKDLNIQNIDELKWTSAEGIDVGPIYHIDEAIRLNIPKSQNDWNVGEYLHFTNVSDASKFVSNAAKGALTASIWTEIIVQKKRFN